MTAAADIGQRIFDLRIEHDIQQGELAQAIHLNQSVLNRIEKGTRPARDKEIRALALFFHVSADHLLGLTDAPSLPDDTPCTEPVPDQETPAPYLLPEEYQLIEKYRALDLRGKHAVSETIDREYEYIQPSPSISEALPD